MRRSATAALPLRGMAGHRRDGRRPHGTAAPACTSFSYSLTAFGPFANAVSYDVQGPAGQLAAGTIGPFGESTSGTVAYPTPFAGSGEIRVFLGWTVPDNNRPRALAGQASVTCTAPPAPTAPNAAPAPPTPPAPPVAPVTPTPAVTPSRIERPRRQVRPRSVGCQGPWAAKPAGVLARRGADGRWYGSRTRRIVTRQDGEVVRVRTVRAWCGPCSVAVTG
jgi:hypothetical protein